MIKRGVDVVDMVENTREISLEDFFESMDRISLNHAYPVNTG